MTFLNTLGVEPDRGDGTENLAEIDRWAPEILTLQ